VYLACNVIFLGFRTPGTYLFIPGSKRKIIVEQWHIEESINEIAGNIAQRAKINPVKSLIPTSVSCSIANAIVVNTHGSYEVASCKDSHSCRISNISF
jgi:hypothetical protein